VEKMYEEDEQKAKEKIQTVTQQAKANMKKDNIVVKVPKNTREKAPRDIELRSVAERTTKKRSNNKVKKRTEFKEVSLIDSVKDYHKEQEDTHVNHLNGKNVRMLVCMRCANSYPRKRDVAIDKDNLCPKCYEKLVQDRKQKSEEHRQLKNRQIIKGVSIEDKPARKLGNKPASGDPVSYDHIFSGDKDVKSWDYGQDDYRKPWTTKQQRSGRTKLDGSRTK